MSKASNGGRELTTQRINAVVRSGSTKLDLSRLDLIDVPQEVAELRDLESLDLSGNRITVIPVFLGTLKSVQHLNMADNLIGSVSESLMRRATIPASLARLAHLKDLNLNRNQIGTVPEFFQELRNLEILDVSENELTVIPLSVTRLSKLHTLVLSGNRISTIPENLTQLTNLRQLLIRRNRIAGIPAWFALLPSLEKLDIEGNPLPEELLAAARQGIDVLFRYLRKLEKRRVAPRTVKVNLLGEPKSGKTTLLEGLKGNPTPCDPSRTETIGVNIVTLERINPDDQEPMFLSVWDFAGQHIEHATHQFFLTDDAIFVILWNARQGPEAGKHDLWYWLELLKMRVKDPKYFLVATHVERTPPDLNLAELESSYPGFQGQYAVELANLNGFAALEEKLINLAAASPAMHAEWPASWLPVRDELRRLRTEAPHITPVQFKRLLFRLGIADEISQRDIANQLHSLGEILYFQDREELSRLVILDPEWIAELIALVVRSKEVRERHGILSTTDLAQLWGHANLTLDVREHLTRLMDWFDLTYSTGHISDIGIVVEALPFSTLEEQKQLALKPDRPQMEMIFRFPTLQRRFLPPGVPTWAIARAHRLSKCRPWADAAAFEDPETGSEALILSSTLKKEVRLRVAADYPPFFFGRMEAILCDTFKRYPGIEPERRLPCPCQKNCVHSYRYETVLKRFRDRHSIVTCDDSGADVPIAVLLTGFFGTEPPETAEGLRALQGEIRRGFTAQLQAIREQSEKTCPSVFTLVPAREFKLLDNWIESVTQGEEFELVLYCEHESGWHPTEHGLYRFRIDRQWLDSIKKNWNSLLSVTKRVAPLAKTVGLAASLPWVGTSMGVIEKLPEASNNLIGELSSALGDRTQAGPVGLESRYLLQSLLNELDTKRDSIARKNGGLLPWLTDDGRKLWLCPDHTKAYRIRL